MEEIIYRDNKQDRIDCFMNKQCPGYSRTYFKNLIKSGKLFVNGKDVSPNYKLKISDKITYCLQDKPSFSMEPEDIPLDIVYEDDDIIVINKQAGIVVHQSYGHEAGTLLNALIYHLKNKSPFMVHRLDKDTTGAIIFAKNQKAKVSLSKQFQKRTIHKIYVTAVCGIIQEDKGRIEAPLGRSQKNRKIIEVGPLAKKMAITEFKVLARTNGITLLAVRIITGRTHQIRSHMKYIGHPVLGDAAYGGSQCLNGVVFNRQMLHSYKIKFSHPCSGKTLELIAEIPNDMKNLFSFVNFYKI